MLELIGTKEYFTTSGGNPYVENIIARLQKMGVDQPVVAELGVGIGATSLRIAKVLNNRGHIHLFDFQEKLDELLKDLQGLGFSNVECFGNTSKHWDSYNWTLAKILLAGKRAAYDYIFVDGAHTFAVDGLAFFLCDLLLKPGGFLEFDDYNWKFSISQWMKHNRQDFMTDEQIDTKQIAMVVDLFVSKNARYESVIENRVYQKRMIATPDVTAPEKTRSIEGKFEYRHPSPQNAVDIFSGKWASNLQAICGVTGTGAANVFSDARIKMAADALGKEGRFDGVTILEIGPLEAAHTQQLEQLGAQVVAVESNTEAFLKCLVVKEILQLKSAFLCGDAIPYLRSTINSYDVVFCSGILYHLADPVEMINLICQHSGSCFVWTHYQSDEAITRGLRKARPIVSAGFETIYYEVTYPDMGYDRFWGGNKPTVAWMTKDEIMRAFIYFGFKCARVLQDHPGHPAGGAFSLAVWR